MANYDCDIIDNALSKFKERRRFMKCPTSLMFDADNTLYRFSTYGEVEVSTREMYSQYFFKNLPIFHEAPIVITNLQKLGFKCGIITTAINSPYCASEKMESFKYYFPMIDQKDIHILDPKTPKWTVTDSIQDTILIDDYHKNIMDWYNAGGIAIKKSYSGKQRPVPVVTSLIDLFSVLRDLNAY